MNTAATSKEAILKACREIVADQGLSAINMRSVAKACHIALGSLYNYFANKDDLLIATIESVWQDIFHGEEPCRTDLSFPDTVQWIFENLQRSTCEYPNFFTTHSLSLAATGKNKAKDTMEAYISHIKMGMVQALHNDHAVNPGAFSRSFSDALFIDFIMSNILMLFVQRTSSCDILIEMIRRSIYADHF